MIQAQPDLEGRLSSGDFVLDVPRLLFDGERLVVQQGRSAIREIERRERLVEIAILVGERAVGGVGNAEREVLVQLGPGERPTELEIVMSGQSSSRRPSHLNWSASDPG